MKVASLASRRSARTFRMGLRWRFLDIENKLIEAHRDGSGKSPMLRALRPPPAAHALKFLWDTLDPGMRDE